MSDLSVLAPTVLLLAALGLFLGIVLWLVRPGVKIAARDAADRYRDGGAWDPSTR